MDSGRPQPIARRITVIPTVLSNSPFARAAMILSSSRLLVRPLWTRVVRTVTNEAQTRPVNDGFLEDLYSYVT